MSFKKPFRAVPIKLGPRYGHKEALQFWKSATGYLLIAAAGGGAIGAGSVLFGQGGSVKIFSTVKPLAIAAGVARRRSPQAGDYWSGCNAARAAGAAPIYADEPGYRVGLDGDGDGIACEPFRGG